MSKAKLVIGILMLAIGVGVGYQLPSNNTEQGNVGEQGQKILFYRNSMNPEVTSPVPAKDNMGMDYVPVYADGEQSDVAASNLANACFASLNAFQYCNS